MCPSIFQVLLWQWGSIWWCMNSAPFLKDIFFFIEWTLLLFSSGTDVSLFPVELFIQSASSPHFIGHTFHLSYDVRKNNKNYTWKTKQPSLSPEVMTGYSRTSTGHILSSLTEAWLLTDWWILTERLANDADRQCLLLGLWFL